TAIPTIFFSHCSTSTTFPASTSAVIAASTFTNSSSPVKGNWTKPNDYRSTRRLRNWWLRICLSCRWCTRTSGPPTSNGSRAIRCIRPASSACGPPITRSRRRRDRLSRPPRSPRLGDDHRRGRLGLHRRPGAPRESAPGTLRTAPPHRGDRKTPPRVRLGPARARAARPVWLAIGDDRQNGNVSGPAARRCGRRAAGVLSGNARADDRGASPGDSFGNCRWRRGGGLSQSLARSPVDDALAAGGEHPDFLSGDLPARSADLSADLAAFAGTDRFRPDFWAF